MCPPQPGERRVSRRLTIGESFVPYDSTRFFARSYENPKNPRNGDKSAKWGQAKTDKQGQAKMIWTFGKYDEYCLLK